MMTLYSAAITLILVMDPLGNIPVFMAALNSVEPKRRHWIILRESFIAFLILAAFLFWGQYFMRAIHISEQALSISGGIILFLIALKMIFPDKEDSGERQVGEPFIVPLAVPLVAGPSALATVLLFATQQPEHLFLWFLALIIASIFVTISLLFCVPIRKLLGEKGLLAMERLMGMILTTVATQMFLSGIQMFFATH